MKSLLHGTTASRLSKALLHIPTVLGVYDVVEGKAQTFGFLLDEYPPVSKLRQLHGRLFAANLHCDPSLAVKLMRAYAARGCTTLTRHVFNQIPHKGVVLFNVMIRSYVTNRLYQEALLVFSDMGRHGTTPDHYTFPCVLKACSGLENLWVGLQIHASVAKVGLHSTVFIGNALVFAYGRCNCILEAQRVFDEMPFKDVVTWNTMIACYAQNGCFGDALQVSL